MAVSFRPSKLTIEGFRGLLHLELELPEKLPTIVVGANNSCKSTILNAVALVLRGGGYHQYTPTDFDFYHEQGGDRIASFSITMELQARAGHDLPAVQAMGNPTFVHAINVAGETEDGGRLVHRHFLLDEDGERILLMPRTSLKGEAKKAFASQKFGPFRRYATLDDIRQLLPTVWLLRPNNIEASLYRWATGPLRRLSRMLAEKFLRTEWDFEHNQQVRRMPDTMARAHEFFSEAVAEFPFWRNDLRPKLEETLGAYLGSRISMQLKPDIQTLEEWLTQQLFLSFAASEGGTPTPLERMGDGWQSVVRLASLEVLSRYPDEVREWIVLLLEEPETHLHPHLRRKFRPILNRLAASGWTIIASTHSPELVSFADSQQIVRMARIGDGVSASPLQTAHTPEELKFQERIDQYGNHEMVLASSAIFCEGKDDAHAIRLGLEKLAVDVDSQGLSILDVGSVSAIPSYCEVAAKLRLPWCAVTDEDPANRITEEHRGRISKLKSGADESLTWAGDLEKVLGASSGKATPRWQMQNVAPLSAADLKTKNPHYMATCSTISEWLSRQ